MNILDLSIWIYISLQSCVSLTIETRLSNISEASRTTSRPQVSRFSPSENNDYSSRKIGQEVQSHTKKEFSFWDVTSKVELPTWKALYGIPLVTLGFARKKRIWWSDDHPKYCCIAVHVVRTTDNEALKRLAHISMRLGYSDTARWKKSKLFIAQHIQEWLRVLDDDNLSIRERFWALGILSSLAKWLQGYRPYWIGNVFEGESITRGELELGLTEGVLCQGGCRISIFSTNTNSYSDILNIEEVESMWEGTGNVELGPGM